jgi:molybdopterin molybdotransferase
MLEVLARAAGFRVRASLRAGDNSEALEAALARADSADLVLLAGGVSAGKYDLVPRVVETAGVRPIFHKVRQKPGKPLLLGVRKDGGPGLFFGLPGNPLAVHACFHRYVLPAGRRMAGREPFRREGRARLAAPFRYKGDRHGFVPAVVRKGADGGWEAEVLVVSGSADIFTAARANALVSLPADGRERPAGEAVDFFWLGPEEEMITWTT